MGGSTIDARGVAYTGASRFQGILSEMNMRKTVINVSGCPCHPDWFMLALADALQGVDVQVDDYRRPTAFFQQGSVHDSCPRRGAFDEGRRDSGPAGDGCLYNLGCKGQITLADCSVRRWNGGVSTCTRAGGLCIACVEPEFPDAFVPFGEKIEDRSLIAGIDVSLGAEIVIGAAALGVGVHAIKRLAIRDGDREDENQPGKRNRREP